MDALLHSLLYITLALGMVLLARKPARRLFGAGPACTLWWLPVALATLPWLPAPPPSLTILPALRVLSYAPTASVATASAHSWQAVLLALWLLGALAGGWRVAAHYLRLRRAARPLPVGMLRHLPCDLPGLEARRLRLHRCGPAVLWAPRALILLPEDFGERFDMDERRLVLRHELGHLARHDPLWSVLAELLAALLWFHPLAWLALPRFRLDQELACDERVLRASPGDDARYARTLARSIGVDTQPVLMPWLVEPQLKERLTMIRRSPCSTTRRRLGYLCLALMLAGSGSLALAATPGQHSNTEASQMPGYNAHHNPRYPPDALRNKEQGTVVLRVLVHADGSVGTITYDAKGSTTTSADLIASASNAVKQWHFNPRMKNGKAVAGYARVPVNYSLDESAAPPGGKAENNSSK
jgi:TonB family protein